MLNCQNIAVAVLALACAGGTALGQTRELIGQEVSGYIPTSQSQLSNLSVEEVLERGEINFAALWTSEEGGGRPMTTGTGGMLSDPSRPLVFPRKFNRVSAQDSNGCAGCHNAPFGVAGGGGDFVTGVFVAAQRFDFATFNSNDSLSKSGTFDEAGNPVTLQSIGNYRATTGMFGGGYYEMLARQITADLQSIRDGIGSGQSAELTSKGISYGVLARDASGGWDTSGVSGIPPQSLGSADEAPSLIIHPWHQSGSVVSLRQFTNNAFNHHHGMQSTERFGDGTDPDGDGFTDELTMGDVTLTALWQAALPVPGQVVPNDIAVEEAIYLGERLFDQVGCASCHVKELPLDNEGWIYTEPNPYNPMGNMQPGDGAEYALDLSSDELPGYRLKPENGVVMVPVFTDFKLHDITSGPGDPNRESLDINQAGGSAEFLGGNSYFLTKRLWGAANELPYFHHGQFTTLREATMAHAGEAQGSRDAFAALSGPDKDRVIEYLKSLQVLPPHVKAGVVDENYEEKAGWPPASFFSWRFSRGAR